jgi:hypothetical protein
VLSDKELKEIEEAAAASAILVLRYPSAARYHRGFHALQAFCDSRRFSGSKSWQIFRYGTVLLHNSRLRILAKKIEHIHATLLAKQ